MKINLVNKLNDVPHGEYAILFDEWWLLVKVCHDSIIGLDDSDDLLELVCLVQADSVYIIP